MIVSGPVCRALAAGSGAHTQGHTHTANPLSCAAASAVLEYLVAEDVVAGAASKGEYLQAQLQEKLGSSPIVGDIRGVGMFYGVEFVKVSRSTHAYLPLLETCRPRLTDCL